MKKRERHQIKRNDFAEFVTRVQEYIEDNLRLVLIVSGTLVVLVIGVFGLRAWLRGRAERASLLVAGIIQAYNAPVVLSLEDMQSTQAGTESFTSAEERSREVLARAEAILQDHATAGAAPKALFYKGLALANLARHDEAVAAFEELTRKYPEDFLAPMARLQMARVREAQGNHMEALVYFEALIDAPQGLLPPEEGLLGAARCKEAMGRKEEALKIYQRILTEFPESEYLGEARRKVDDLS